MKQDCFRFMETMKVVFLAGGYGTRISEESHLRPKPMIEIGGRPVLWHIMKCYSRYGFNEFVVCAGYKQHVIKEWFSNYFLYNSDVTFDFSNSRNALTVHHQRCEPWRVTIVDTGSATATGGRLKRIREYVGDETFMMTYGDGVCDIDIRTLVDFHKKHGKTATLTAVLQEQTKGVLSLSPNGSVRAFREKKDNDAVPINVGFMVLESNVFSYIDGDDTAFEEKPLATLAKEGQLSSYLHHGFWQCMDTLREKELLEDLWKSGKAPWKVWKD